MLGAKMIGTASEGSIETVRQYGGTPLRYGDGLEQRVRELAPDGVCSRTGLRGDRRGRRRLARPS
jgi:hypothetical protein